MPDGPSAAAEVEIDLVVEGGDWTALGPAPDRFVSETITAALAAVRRQSGRPWPGPFIGALTLSTDAAVRELNRAHRGADKPTNVLSFPAWDAPGLAALAAGKTPPGHPPGLAVPLGDIVMAAETVAREAAAQDKTVAGHGRHLVVHGFLHLLGYDHVRDEDADVMEALETTILATFDIANPYTDRGQSADCHE